LGRGQLARIIELKTYVILVSLVNLWLTSVIIWLVVGLSSIGTSVIMETLLIAFINTVYVTLRHKSKSKLMVAVVDSGVQRLAAAPDVDSHAPHHAPSHRRVGHVY